MNKIINLIIFTILLNLNHCLSNDISVDSVRLAFVNNEPSSIRVTWWTKDKMESPIVLFNKELFDPISAEDTVIQVEGKVLSYDTLGFHGHPTTTIIKNLDEMTRYFYCVGDKKSGSFTPVYNFTTGRFNSSTMGLGEVEPFTVSFFGDMGFGGKGMDSQNYTINNILERSNDIDFIVHVGDIAYADLTIETTINGNQTIWNQFLNSINPISSSMVYQTCPGNHDIFYDLSVYRKTWMMPISDTQDDKASWYSFNYNGVHFVAISSEHDFLPNTPQHNWIQSDLKSYRQDNPNGFIVAYAHRPFYCSTVWNWCNTTKDELKKAFVYSLENLLYTYNVDLYIAGHTHSSEITLPTVKNEPYGSFSDPKATIHITIGTGGNAEGNQKHWVMPLPVWSSGSRISDNGFGLLNIINSTTMSWQFVANINNTITHEIYITKGYF